MKPLPPIVVGVTGASGAPLALATLEALLQYTDWPVECIFTETARRVWVHELPGVAFPHDPRIEYYENGDFFAPPASGSHPTRGMVVVPCSMGSLAKMAHGVADSLLLRAVDVTLKERRPLLVAPREAPLSIIHLENMATLARAGAAIVPPMLTFYHGALDARVQATYFAYHLLQLLGADTPRPQWGSM